MEPQKMKKRSNKTKMTTDTDSESLFLYGEDIVINEDYTFPEDQSSNEKVSGLVIFPCENPDVIIDRLRLIF